MTRWLEAGGPQLGRRVQKGFSFPEGAAEDGTVYKVDWVDEKIHTSRESVYFLYEKIAGQLVPQLLCAGRGFEPVWFEKRTLTTITWPRS